MTILVAIGGALIAANATSVNTPVAISAITTGLGILSVLLILYRIIDPPGSGDIPDGFDIGISRGIGVFLGLIAAGGIAYGGWRAMEEEGTSFGDQADRFSGGGGGTSPPPPPAGRRADTGATCPQREPGRPGPTGGGRLIVPGGAVAGIPRRSYNGAR